LGTGLFNAGLSEIAWSSLAQSLSLSLALLLLLFHLLFALLLPSLCPTIPIQFPCVSLSVSRAGHSILETIAAKKAGALFIAPVGIEFQCFLPFGVKKVALSLELSFIFQVSHDAVLCVTNALNCFIATSHGKSEWSSDRVEHATRDAQMEDKFGPPHACLIWL
jgi:hypothetical protein